MASVLSTAGVNANKFVINTSDAGREQILKISADAGILDAELLAIYRALTQPAGAGFDYSTGTPDTNGPDAFTVAGVAGTVGTDPVYVALQGTGTPSATPVTGFTLTVVATFDQNPS